MGERTNQLHVSFFHLISFWRQHHQQQEWQVSAIQEDFSWRQHHQGQERQVSFFHLISFWRKHHQRQERQVSAIQEDFSCSQKAPETLHQQQGRCHGPYLHKKDEEDYLGGRTIICARVEISSKESEELEEEDIVVCYFC